MSSLSSAGPFTSSSSFSSFSLPFLSRSPSSSLSLSRSPSSFFSVNACFISEIVTIGSGTCVISKYLLKDKSIDKLFYEKDDYYLLNMLFGKI